ncbi:guanine nucleotide-binding protein g(q) subunit alpha [Anaeramoeba ignava]|uniref:Guanine nucleotide-binding protein g(Q) subunit alpha n=1 Tax=Anaeramoeba ignava TaxID=1746090 RepID=A0A9Q0LJS9_ANAIG|nr:guanine nucleotide-binding protein g(q) subunit alpha [Anaeramoeba ignava]
MGSKVSKDKIKRQKRSEQIDEELKKQAEAYKKEVKLLVLGTGESGKSTFIKQIQILFQNGFGPQDFKIYRNVIRHNLIDHTKVLIKGTRKLDIPLLQENNKLAQKFLKEAQLVKGQIPSDTISNIKRLWNDPALKITFNSRSELQIPDTKGLFLDDLDRITASNYQPTNNDILSCRIPTTGVRMLSFDHKGSPWRVIDVGGQRSERRKWIHHFDNVSVTFMLLP